MPSAKEWNPGSVFGLLGRVVVWCRWLVVPGWLAVTAAAWLLLPGLHSGGSLSLQSVVPADARALQVQQRAIAAFGLPVLSRTAVVVRAAGGLSVEQQRRLVQASLQTFGSGRHRFEAIAAAVPITNLAGALPSARESSTTAVIYLFFRPETPSGSRADIAERWAHDVLPVPPGATVAVIGPIVAEQAQGRLISGALPWVEVGTLVVVVLVVGVRFRSVVSPVLALLAVGISYVLTTRLLGWLAERHGFAVPGALEPLLVVLLVGVGTDYAVFILAGYQGRLGESGRPRDAMAQAVRGVLPIILTAGLAVAAGTASLLVARLQLFRRLGPGMAITVLVTMLVTATFLPAAAAVLGRVALWPSREARRSPSPRGGRLRFRRAVLRVVVHPVPAVLVILAGAALLYVGIQPLASFRMGANVVTDLPSSSEPARALQAASAGFAPGIVAPTELVLSGHGIADSGGALVELQRRLAAVPGVAGIIGPVEQPLPLRFGAVYAPSGDAVRMLIVLRDPPYGSAAVGDLARLQDRLPGLLAATGLHTTSVGWAGDTAVVQEVVATVRSDLFRVGLVALGVLLVILILFLRALVAPVFLLLVSAAVVAAALGATLWLFSALTPGGGPTFFVPLAVAVLLLAFGSDYNIFLVGRIREHSAGEPWRAAVVSGGAEASRAIGSAGLALAGSFAMLALVPLDAFREFAFAMVVGILLDTFVVRSYVVPAALGLLGRAAGWPGHRIGRGAEPG